MSFFAGFLRTKVRNFSLISIPSSEFVIIGCSDVSIVCINGTSVFDVVFEVFEEDFLTCHKTPQDEI